MIKGFHPIPDSSPDVYSPDMPYSIEKPPTMQLPESYGSAAFSSDHPPPFYGEPSDAAAPTALVYAPPQQQSLPVSSEHSATNSFQQASSNYGFNFSPVNPVVKQEPALSPNNASFGPNEQMFNTDPSALQYSVNLLDDGIPPPPVRVDECMPSEAYEYDYNIVSYQATQNGAPIDAGNNVAQHGQQTTFNILPPHQRGGKRGPFKDLALREQTAQTRKIGSCIRCRMQRIRVREPRSPFSYLPTYHNRYNVK